MTITATDVYADDYRCLPPPLFAYLANWHDCMDAAVDTFYNQPESAETIVVAAFGTCSNYELAYINASSGNAACIHAFTEELKKSLLKEQALARVMAARAAAAARAAKPRHAEPHVKRIPNYDQLLPSQR
jgi:hypothetical protein